MGLLEWFANGLDQPLLETYRCSHCNRRFDEEVSSCPGCGGEIEIEGVPASGVHYWSDI